MAFMEHYHMALKEHYQEALKDVEAKLENGDPHQTPEELAMVRARLERKIQVLEQEETVQRA